MMQISMICLLHLVVVCADPPGTRMGATVISEDEAFLQKHLKIATDNASLLKLLHNRAELSEEISRLDTLVAQMGSASYEKRDAASRLLITCGRVALPYLRKRFGDGNLELSRRAKACAEAIENDARPDWSLPVTRLLLERKAPGAFEALLAFLPCTYDPEVEEEIYYGLDELIANGKPMPASLVRALEDVVSARRAIAACIIGRRGNLQQQSKVRQIMQTDRSTSVQLRAAQGLLAVHDKTTIPALIKLLSEPSLTIGWQAEELLRWSTDAQIPQQFGRGTEDERKTCHLAWSNWWSSREAKFDWPKAGMSARGPGMVGVVDTRSSQSLQTAGDFVWLCGHDGYPRYEYTRADYEKIFGVVSLPLQERWKVYIRNEHTILRDQIPMMQGFGRRHTEVNEKGIVVWETFSDSGQVFLVLPLLRFGWDPSGSRNGSIESVSHRLRYLNSSSPRFRAYAIDQLKKESLEEDGWKSVLKLAQQEQDPFIRQRALEILPQSPVYCRKHLPAFIEMLKKDDTRCLTAIFASAGPTAAVPPLLQVFNERKAINSALWRANAIHQLGINFLFEDALAEQAIHQAFCDKQLLVQKYAVQTVSWHAPKTTNFVPDLIVLAGHSDQETAMSAVYALSRMGEHAEPARLILLKLLSERKELRVYVVRALAVLKNRDPKLVSVLLPYLHEQEGPDVVQAIVESVAWENRPKEALQPLIRLLEWKDVWRAGFKNVLDAIEKYGPEAAEAVPHLKNLSGSLSHDKEIQRCLERIDPVAGKEAHDSNMKTRANPGPFRSNDK